MNLYLALCFCVACQEKEMEKQKILYQQARLHARGAAEMVLQMISASKGNRESDKSLRLAISRKLTWNIFSSLRSTNKQILIVCVIIKPWMCRFFSRARRHVNSHADDPICWKIHMCFHMNRGDINNKNYIFLLWRFRVNCPAARIYLFSITVNSSQVIWLMWVIWVHRCWCCWK